MYVSVGLSLCAFLGNHGAYDPGRAALHGAPEQEVGERSWRVELPGREAGRVVPAAGCCLGWVLGRCGCRDGCWSPEAGALAAGSCSWTGQAFAPASSTTHELGDCGSGIYVFCASLTPSAKGMTAIGPICRGECED